MSQTWIRNENIPYPNTWRKFERKSKTKKDVTYKFQIQDATDEDAPEIVKHMIENFIQDEPLCKMLNIQDQPNVVKSFESHWTSKIKRRTVIICTVDDYEKLNVNRIVGCNITFVSKVGDGVPSIECQTLEKVLRVFHYMDTTADIFKKFKTDQILVAAGLSVDKDFRGYGIGVELLSVREALCKAFGISVTTSLFTSQPGQIVAKRAGFSLLLEKEYNEIATIVPDLPTISQSINLQLMYLKVD